MKIPNITGLMKVGKAFILANRPEILFGASVTATLATAVLAAKGGYEARGIIERERADRVFNGMESWPKTYLEFSEAMDASPQIQVKEKIQLTWLCYMPAMVTTVAAVGSTTGLHLVHVKDKKMMAQAGLAAIEEVKNAAKEFENDAREAIRENAAPKTAEKIEGALEERVQARLVESGDLYLVRDAYTGRSFYATEPKIQAAINEINDILGRSRGDAELNTFYAWAGVPEIERGDQVGWSGAFVTLKWSDSHLEDGRPVREFTFHPQPKSGFDSKHG